MPFELTLVLLAGIAATLSLSSALRYRKVPVSSNASSDQLRDARLLQEHGINLLDEQQLAEVQVARNAPRHIWVLAPEPLELHSESFYRSTKAWVQRHADFKANPVGSLSVDPESASLVFWYRRSQRLAPPALKIIRRLRDELPQLLELQALFRLVEFPDDLLVMDHTVHFFADGTTLVHLNAKDRDVTRTLQEIPAWHSMDFMDRVWRWLSAATVETAPLYPTHGPSHTEVVERFRIPDTLFVQPVAAEIRFDSSTNAS
jgi:hypothetical protein